MNLTRESYRDEPIFKLVSLLSPIYGIGDELGYQREAEEFVFDCENFSIFNTKDIETFLYFFFKRRFVVAQVTINEKNIKISVYEEYELYLKQALDIISKNFPEHKIKLVIMPSPIIPVYEKFDPSKLVY